MPKIMEEKHRDPDSFLELIRREGRGNLKLFLGFAAGVGKTYRMLQEAHNLKNKGVDVVVGVIDAHGRKDTELLLEGLEQIPPREVIYKGMKLFEPDVDAIVKRHPELVLIDELAHTNAAGSRHNKRWEDVEELLDKGVNAMATMNVQHIESLNDDVARTTKIRVLETVPDKFILEQVDEIVDVDLPVDELLDRLKEGKIYPKERVTSALHNFFQTHNLTSLREFSLREVAKSVGAKAAKKEFPSSDDNNEEIPRERILVAAAPYSQNSRALIRKGARFAGQLNTDWDVLFVVTFKDDEKRRTITETQFFSDTMDLSRSIGARVVKLEGKNVAHTIIDYAQKNRVGKIVIGSTWHPWYKRLFRENIMGHVLKEAGSIDVYVVRFGRPKRFHISPLNNLQW